MIGSKNMQERVFDLIVGSTVEAESSLISSALSKGGKPEKHIEDISTIMNEHRINVLQNTSRVLEMAVKSDNPSQALIEFQAAIEDHLDDYKEVQLLHQMKGMLNHKIIQRIQQLNESQKDEPVRQALLEELQVLNESLEKVSKEISKRLDPWGKGGMSVLGGLDVKTSRSHLQEADDERESKHLGFEDSQYSSVLHGQNQEDDKDLMHNFETQQSHLFQTDEKQLQTPQISRITQNNYQTEPDSGLTPLLSRDMPKMNGFQTPQENLLQKKPNNISKRGENFNGQLQQHQQYEGTDSIPSSQVNQQSRNIASPQVTSFRQSEGTASNAKGNSEKAHWLTFGDRRHYQHDVDNLGMDDMEAQRPQKLKEIFDACLDSMHNERQQANMNIETLSEKKELESSPEKSASEEDEEEKEQEDDDNNQYDDSEDGKGDTVQMNDRFTLDAFEDKSENQRDNNQSFEEEEENKQESNFSNNNLKDIKNQQLFYGKGETKKVQQHKISEDLSVESRINGIIDEEMKTLKINSGVSSSKEIVQNENVVSFGKVEQYDQFKQKLEVEYELEKNDNEIHDQQEEEEEDYERILSEKINALKSQLFSGGTFGAASQGNTFSKIKNTDTIKPVIQENNDEELHLIVEHPEDQMIGQEEEENQESNIEGEDDEQQDQLKHQSKIDQFQESNKYYHTLTEESNQMQKQEDQQAQQQQQEQDQELVRQQQVQQELQLQERLKYQETLSKRLKQAVKGLNNDNSQEDQKNQTKSRDNENIDKNQNYNKQQQPNYAEEYDKLVSEFLGNNDTFGNNKLFQQANSYQEYSKYKNKMINNSNNNNQGKNINSNSNRGILDELSETSTKPTVDLLETFGGSREDVEGDSQVDKLDQYLRNKIENLSGILQSNSQDVRNVTQESHKKEEFVKCRVFGSKDFIGRNKQDSQNNRQKQEQNEEEEEEEEEEQKIESLQEEEEKQEDKRIEYSNQQEQDEEDDQFARDESELFESINNKAKEAKNRLIAQQMQKLQAQIQFQQKIQQKQQQMNNNINNDNRNHSIQDISQVSLMSDVQNNDSYISLANNLTMLQQQQIQQDLQGFQQTGHFLASNHSQENNIKNIGEINRDNHRKNEKEEKVEEEVRILEEPIESLMEDYPMLFQNSQLSQLNNHPTSSTGASGLGLNKTKKIGRQIHLHGPTESKLLKQPQIPPSNSSSSSGLVSQTKKLPTNLSTSQSAKKLPSSGISSSSQPVLQKKQSLSSISIPTEKENQQQQSSSTTALNTGNLSNPGSQQKLEDPEEQRISLQKTLKNPPSKKPTRTSLLPPSAVSSKPSISRIQSTSKSSVETTDISTQKETSQVSSNRLQKQSQQSISSTASTGIQSKRPINTSNNIQSTKKTSSTLPDSQILSKNQPKE